MLRAAGRLALTLLAGTPACSPAAGSSGAGATAPSAAAAVAPAPRVREERSPPAEGGQAVTVLRGPRLGALDVPGHLAAIVAVPAGATSRRPVLVATHGAGGDPEWECRFWMRTVVGRRGFVLCPTGRSLGRAGSYRYDGYYYPDHRALGREVQAALAALGDAFPDHADLAAPVYAGFSQGASMGALALWQGELGFAGAVLIEGGFGEWNVEAARRFHAAGGHRVLFACGQAGCQKKAKIAAGHLGRAGVEALVEYDAASGHSVGPELGRKLSRGFEWIVENDARWRATDSPARP